MGVAWLPGYRLVFNKHSVSRGCDAANMAEFGSEAVYGYLYEVRAKDRQGLRRRERGYKEKEVKVKCSRAGVGDGTAVTAFTFVAERRCSRGCGPGAAYLGLVLEGARSQGLPEEWIRVVKGKRATRA